MTKRANIVDTDRDFLRIRVLLESSPNGVRSPDIAHGLGMAPSRVLNRLAFGRKEGLFVLCCTGSPAWFSFLYADSVVERQVAALATEIERRQARSRAHALALRTRDVEADGDVDLLPVRRRVVSDWVGVRVAPGVNSVFALGDAALSNC